MRATEKKAMTRMTIAEILKFRPRANSSFTELRTSEECSSTLMFVVEGSAAIVECCWLFV